MTGGKISIESLARELRIKLPPLEKFCTDHHITVTSEGHVSRLEIEHITTSIVIRNFKREFGENWTHAFQLHVGQGLLPILFKNAIIRDFK